MRPYFVLCTLLLLFFSPLSALAQGGRTTTVFGTVIDAQDKSPLIGAVVSIDNAKHAITDVNGQFSIAGVAVSRDSTKVEVSYLGYKTLQRTISATASRTVLGAIELNPEGKMMDAVTVKAPPVIAVQKGDTLQYNAEAFKTNPDADASDLVSKMPGMQVTSSGVQAQGETVTRAYVDGKLLFGNDVMTALNNLPADAVESIQLFDEQSDDARFTGFDDGRRQRALNIVTKNKSKRSTVARVNGDYGRLLEKSQLSGDELFSFRGNFNTFSEQNRLSVMAVSNNVNTWNAGASGRAGSITGGNSQNMGGDIFTNRALMIGGFTKLGSKAEVTGGYRYNDRQNVRRTITLRDYFATDQFNSRITRDTSNSRSNTLSHNADLRLEYKPNATNRIFFNPTVSISDPNSISSSRQSNTVDGNLNSVTNTDTDSRGETVNTGGLLTYQHSFTKKGRFVSTSLDFRFNESNTTNHQIDTTENTSRRRNLEKFFKNFSRNATARLMYGEPIAPNQQLGISYAFNYENSRSNRLTYDLLDDANLDESLSNDFTRRFYSNSAGLAYNIILKNGRFNAGVDYRAVHVIKDQYFPAKDFQDRSFTMWLPRIEYNYEIRKSRSLRVAYQTSSPVPSVEQFQNVINSNNLQNLTAGNPTLKLSYTHNINIDYTTTRPEKSTTFFIRLRNTVTQNRISDRTIYFAQDTILADYNDFVAQKGSQLTIPYNLNGFFSSRLTTGYSFPMKPLRTNVNLTADYRFSHVPSYAGNLLNTSNQQEANFSVGFVSNISSNVDFNVTYGTRFNYTTNSVKTNTQFWRQVVSGQLNLIFLGGFVFSNDFAYDFNHSSALDGYTTQFMIWNSGLGRKFLQKKQAEVRVTVYDVLKQRKSLTHTIGDQYIMDQWDYIRGRYIMATLTYRFNSMNMSRPSQGQGGPQRYEGGGPPPEGMRFREGGGPPGGGYQPGGGGGNVPF